jgi:GNAT superfamily N-acetyltransferase
MIWTRESFTVTSDPSKVDRDVVADFLATSYWAGAMPRERILRSLEHSLCFSLHAGDSQIGFGRFVTDYSTFAYMRDVFVLPEYRGRGLGRWLVECMLSHEALEGIPSWMLGTKDAHGLYEKFGYARVTEPNIYMVRGQRG